MFKILLCTAKKIPHFNRPHIVTVNSENKMKRINAFSGESGKLLIRKTLLNLADWGDWSLNNVLL
jgi:hypothetical protein